MIKTLRITSIIAAIAATGLLVLPAVYGVRSDPKIEEFLKSPGVVEKFTSAKGQHVSKDQSQNSPLVKQAADLGRYFNPPPPPKPEPNAQSSALSQPAPPVPVAAKFPPMKNPDHNASPREDVTLDGDFNRRNLLKISTLLGGGGLVGQATAPGASDGH